MGHGWLLLREGGEDDVMLVRVGVGYCRGLARSTCMQLWHTNSQCQSHAMSNTKTLQIILMHIFNPWVNNHLQQFCTPIWKTERFGETHRSLNSDMIEERERIRNVCKSLNWDHDSRQRGIESTLDLWLRPTISIIHSSPEPSDGLCFAFVLLKASTTLL